MKHTTDLMISKEVYDSESETDTELDDKWIVHFEKTDKLYQDYYLDNVHYACIYYIYVNNTNSIEKIKEEMFIMSKLGCIMRNELIDLIKRNCIIQNKTYSLLSLLKFNITMEPSEIKHCYGEELIDFGNKYFTVIRQIDTVFFQNTIHMFQDLNSLIIVFYNEECKNEKYLPSSNSIIKNKNFTQKSNSTTKKIKFDTIIKMNIKSKSKSKTFRKQYKE